MEPSEAGETGVTTTASQSNRHKGRIQLEVDISRLTELRMLNFTWSQISLLMGVSTKTLQRRAKAANIVKYSSISDSETDHYVEHIVNEFPRVGEVMLAGHLRTRGIIVQRSRLRSSIQRIRGPGSLAPCIDRRSYNVPGPNFLWHADGNHKLIKYRLVIHGCIDGFSRLITYMRCSDNNRAETVLRCFFNAVAEYGVPARVRTDKGGENVDIWKYMVDVRGQESQPYLTGSSVHNCRIKRLWRDVRYSVISTYSEVFDTLQRENVLDVENETDLYCLHYIFLPRINKSLTGFLQAWNSHALSTEGNFTPQQLYTANLRNSPPSEEIDTNAHCIDQQLENNSIEEEESVSVPRTHSPLLQHESDILQDSINPLAESNAYGADLYVQALFMVNNFIENNS